MKLMTLLLESQIQWLPLLKKTSFKIGKHTFDPHLSNSGRDVRLDVYDAGKYDRLYIYVNYIPTEVRSVSQPSYLDKTYVSGYIPKWTITYSTNPASHVKGKIDVKNDKELTDALKSILDDAGL